MEDEEMEEMEDVFEEEEFLPVKTDLDYEFDASGYFDFSREESPLEAREAEMWFDRAGSYPPSPFVAKLKLGVEILGETVRTSLKSKDMEDRESTSTHSDTDMDPELSVLDERCRGLTFYNHMEKDIRKAKTKSATKTSIPRGSTLMKPTASQLAKQNRPHDAHGSHRFLERFQKPFLQNSDRSLDNVSSVGIQAAKRQKLEGGHLRKVAGTKQQYSLTHKAPQKDGIVDSTSAHTKLKITIPREPDLETAHRAQRMRPKNSTDLQEQVKRTTYRFKARPLNRKILEAPSLPLPQKSTPRLPEFQVFHLKTLERALQHSSAASSSSLPSDKSDKVLQKHKASPVTQNGTTDSKRPATVDVPKQEESETTHKFKARPLNKKIFSSKGDIGVFRNSKREPTVPMEFNFPTDKRFQYNPPVELFNKLSLATELRQNTVSQPRLPRRTCVPTKGSKENSVDSLQQGNRKIHTVKARAQMFSVKQTQCGGDLDTDVGTRANMSRSLDIR